MIDWETQSWLSLPTAGAAAAILLIFSLIRNRGPSVWSCQGIPCPNQWLNQLDVLRSDWISLDLKRSKQYGKVFGIADGSCPMLVVCDPEILKDMLVRNFVSFSDRNQQFVNHRVLSKFLTSLSGDEWREQRNTISPTFTSGKIKAMFPIVKEAVAMMTNLLDMSGSAEVDLKQVFGCMTMDIIAKCGFAIDTDAKNNPNNPFVVNARAFFSEISPLRLILAQTLPDSLKNWLQFTVTGSSPLDNLTSIAEQILAERRKQMREGISNQQYKDFMQLMIEAASHDDHPESDTEEELDSPAAKRPMTDLEIVANSMLILIAGYETTASTLMFASYSLALNAEEQERLRQEVSAAGDLDYDTVMKLPYLDAVINETLRIYPPVMRIDRHVSDKDGYTFTCDLGEIHMPRGTGVYVPIYALHHNEEYFPDPEKFDPQRFMPENRGKIVPYTFAPFMMGPRNCVGMRFALLEAKLTLATLIRDFELTPSAATKVPLDISNSVFNLSVKDAVIRIQRRTSTA